MGTQEEVAGVATTNCGSKKKIKLTMQQAHVASMNEQPKTFPSHWAGNLPELKNSTVQLVWQEKQNRSCLRRCQSWI